MRAGPTQRRNWRKDPNLFLLLPVPLLDFSEFSTPAGICCIYFHPHCLFLFFLFFVLSPFFLSYTHFQSFFAKEKRGKQVPNSEAFGEKLGLIWELKVIERGIEIDI